MECYCMGQSLSTKNHLAMIEASLDINVLNVTVFHVALIKEDA